jgi:hypothetical protein
MLLWTNNVCHASGGQQPAMVIREMCPRCQSPQHKKHGHLHHGQQTHHGHNGGQQFADGFAQDLIAADTCALIARGLVKARHNIPRLGSARIGPAGGSSDPCDPSIPLQ